MDQPTHALIEKNREKMAKIFASVKTTHKMSPKGTKLGYAAAIMTASKYWRQVNQLETTWTFIIPTNTDTYDPNIKTLTAEVAKSEK